MSRNRYGGFAEDPYTNGNGNGGYGSPIRETDDYDPYGNDYGDRYGSPPVPANSPPATRNQSSRPRRAPESKAEKEIGVVLEHIKFMLHYSF
jgi:exocyst complex component 4